MCHITPPILNLIDPIHHFKFPGPSNRVWIRTKKGLCAGSVRCSEHVKKLLHKIF